MINYMRFVNHGDFEQLIKDIKVSKGVYPEETETALGELRLLYYYRSDKRINPPLINFFTPEQIKQKIAMNFEESIFGMFN